MKPLYFVNHGCNYSHRKMQIKSFTRLKDARAYYEAAKSKAGHLYEVGELIRQAPPPSPYYTGTPNNKTLMHWGY